MDLYELQIPGDAATDAANEKLIDAAYDLMIGATSAEVARTYFYEMLRYVRQRSPERIFTMEIERRLKTA